MNSRISARTHKALVGALSTLAAAGAVTRFRSNAPDRAQPVTKRAVTPPRPSIKHATGLAAMADNLVSNRGTAPSGI